MTHTRFPGGLALVLGPLFMLAGALLRAGHDFFFPDQLAAFAAEPVLIQFAYGAFLIGDVVLWPGVVLLAVRIGETRPGWALWGGMLTVFGLFARAFHAGVDHLAFQLVDLRGVASATSLVSDAYGAYHVMSALNPAIMAGWVVLAFGAWRAGVLGPFRAVALGLMAALPIGVLKGTTAMSVVALAGLAVALVSLGHQELRAAPRPPARRIALTAAAIAAMAFVGTLG
ncbi:hypothetical protein SAMN02982929_04212 [Saccharopolyspora kobensis]|uniref:Uncharacterized protein n=1 Tax=Saccharopolyspora kobensis TaxID=146035 RepID=A0A1H6DD23_9PSEU|nr:hypothetical protein [Saccharopolyspora kobensis]SEG83188.1 hypothetical protein SAMN02982929_04212 [Saccharopolyspora kobensis]SFE29089.1 hypothetical protein SAMN05216506_110129 [Saccharopolyspora kobensis]